MSPPIEPSSKLHYAWIAAGVTVGTLLAAAGAEVPRGIVASSRAEAQAAFDRMGGPVVLKVRSNKLYGSLTAVGSGAPGGSSTGTAWDLRFTGRGEQSLYWNLDATGWWYDLVVTSDVDPSFLRRLAGRMETGRHSVSDPGMGLADSF